MQNYLQSFVDSLYKFITSNEHCQCSAIIRNHSEALHKHGEFSFPAQLKPWLHHFPAERHNNTELEKHFLKCCQDSELSETSSIWCLKIVSVSEINNRIHLYLRRPYAIKLSIFQSIQNDKIIKNIVRRKFHISEDSTQKSEDSLSNLRVTLIRQVIENLASVCFYEVEELPDIAVTARSSYEALEGAKVVLCGPVLNLKTSAKEVHITAEDYIKKRQTEMTLIAQHKYGVRTLRDDRWKTLVSRLGEAAVKYELLQTRPAAAVKINFDHPTSGCSKGAAFVLYNCARLETLMRTFQQKVESGEYQQPPSVEDTDYSLLTDEDEWNLVFNYVLGFPSVLHSCLRLDGDAVTVAPHLLCSFLSSLVRTFSQYYRRVRILTEGRAHLMPVLFARVRLLEALQVTLRTSLRLLDIDYVSTM